MSGISNFLFGSQSQMKPFNQQSLQSLLSLLQGGGLQDNSLYGAGQGFLQNLLSGNPEATKSFEAPYLQQFEQQIAPGIAERFAGMGTGGGAGSSSALTQSLSQAGGNLQTQLAALRSGLQMQALPQALQYSQSPIQNALQAAGLIPGQFFEKPGQGGLLHGVGGAFGQGLGSAIGGSQGFQNIFSNLFGGQSRPQGRPLTRAEFGLPGA